MRLATHVLCYRDGKLFSLFPMFGLHAIEQICMVSFERAQQRASLSFSSTIPREMWIREYIEFEIKIHLLYDYGRLESDTLNSTDELTNRHADGNKCDKVNFVDLHLHVVILLEICQLVLAVKLMAAAINSLTNALFIRQYLAQPNRCPFHLSIMRFSSEP